MKVKQLQLRQTVVCDIWVGSLSVPWLRQQQSHVRTSGERTGDQIGEWLLPGTVPEEEDQTDSAILQQPQSVLGTYKQGSHRMRGSQDEEVEEEQVATAKALQLCVTGLTLSLEFSSAFEPCPLARLLCVAFICEAQK